MICAVLPAVRAEQTLGNKYEPPKLASPRKSREHHDDTQSLRPAPAATPHHKQVAEQPEYARLSAMECSLNDPALSGLTAVPSFLAFNAPLKRRRHCMQLHRRRESPAYRKNVEIEALGQGAPQTLRKDHHHHHRNHAEDN
jgi:hypothetical protein